MKTASRLDHIEPFYVMECAKAAQRDRRQRAVRPARGGRPMIWLNIGEPDFGAAPLVREAAQRAIRDGRTQYTQATGLPELREAIAQWYQQRFGIRVAPRRIVVTAGASAALAARVRRAVRGRRRRVDARPLLPVQPPFRRRRRRARHAAAHRCQHAVPARAQHEVADAWGSHRRAACCWRRHRTRPARRSIPTSWHASSRSPPSTTAPAWSTRSTSA